MNFFEKGELILKETHVSMLEIVKLFKEMVKLNSENLATFVQLLEEEHTINNSLISTIYDILMEATGYVELETEVKNSLTKKQKEKTRLKKRQIKQTMLRF